MNTPNAVLAILESVSFTTLRVELVSRENTRKNQVMLALGGIGMIGNGAAAAGLVEADPEITPALTAVERTLTGAMIALNFTQAARPDVDVKAVRKAVLGARVAIVLVKTGIKFHSERKKEREAANTASNASVAGFSRTDSMTGLIK